MQLVSLRHFSPLFCLAAGCCRCRFPEHFHEYMHDYVKLFKPYFFFTLLNWLIILNFSDCCFSSAASAPAGISNVQRRASSFYWVYRDALIIHVSWRRFLQGLLYLNILTKIWKLVQRLLQYDVQQYNDRSLTNRRNAHYLHAKILEILHNFLKICIGDDSQLIPQKILAQYL